MKWYFVSYYSSLPNVRELTLIEVEMVHTNVRYALSAFWTMTIKEKHLLPTRTAPALVAMLPKDEDPSTLEIVEQSWEFLDSFIEGVVELANQQFKTGQYFKVPLE